MKHFTVILIWLIECHALCQPLKERVILFTDRNLYISGENIQFSALIKPENDSAEVSQILYCELITPVGRRISGGKFAAVDREVSGRLLIPPDLITGVYYLRGYTKAMRNEGPSVYSYDYIKIVNPYRNEVNDMTEDESVVKEPDLIIMDTVISNSVKLPPTALPGESVRIMIEGPSLCRTLKILTFSIIPDNTLLNRSIPPPEEKNLIDDDFHLAEANGILITGIVKTRSGHNSIPGIRVNLSITGKGRDFMSATTGPDGRFVFSAPEYSGNRDIFLSTESPDSLAALILVDNDFCNLPVILQEKVFTLSDIERETALRMAFNLSLEKYFNEDSTLAEDHTSEETPVFYGKPDEILVMDEFIQLPTLEEYFNQLPVPVKIRKRSGHKYFKVLGRQAELMEIDPLVMVDLVVIDDPEKILSLDPRDIRRIEIVNALYVKADRIYGGVVNIISRKGDFAGISLPSSGVFINFPFLSDTGINPGNPGIAVNGPDTRNTVYWKTITKTDECSNLSFRAPATPGKYNVVVRGVNENGYEVSGIFLLIVEEQ